ncbi:hypothetical protein GU243_21005 [Pseudarthrobacter psychrotolerans]|uniref:Uncharacterized protein n=1 Tax=Pseudarthrobacter psychrotolerans TaxID=2697569 RepID=A0A6P1NTP6_9MICC|nr:hypothetical protein [Pseudarthrobacter psychrotolerans]QHK21750.1 hypothetical protein GU243_21005 [Pseudarthrobacter psychrotolerans]
MSTSTHRRRAHAAAPVNDQHTSDSAFDDDDRAMQIAAAQLRVVTDRRLGKTTPEWVQELAKEDAPQDS